ncbi:hypothetical protein A3G06_01235 [Candidatus Nomurabacteria bacterium RIFCSPLOWO2_12_FULL_46_14]|uniref:DUF1648 domain-containing protein n=1 Tax=Candidatus Nomurabacteria bacterium RIFCSPLOWO2_12_FULL_46_14 TaxID=1801797 RepID=A0A1F6Y808_9BACT|nr:MAG: hypothetical protein A3G06_01235 [Candidatus Nomurabacteria bacterium RIFCSPLOWO2_12_FULL_46_14]
MSTKVTNIVLLVVIVISFGAGVGLYPSLPDQMASHWNAAGAVDDYMGKFWGTFLLPTIMLMMLVLYFIIPKIDPLGKNIGDFRKYYNLFWVFLFLFMAYVFKLTILWNLGWQFDFTLLLMPALAVLWFCLGVFLKRAKRNWFVGIRTPWTLSSDLVWDKTHQVGGRLFQVTAPIILISIWFQDKLFYFLFIPVMATILFCVIYSYILYWRENKS